MQVRTHSLAQKAIEQITHNGPSNIILKLNVCLKTTECVATYRADSRLNHSLKCAFGRIYIARDDVSIDGSLQKATQCNPTQRET